MTDRFTPEKRSQIMSRVRGRDTAPERLVRSMLHRMGYRFRLHCSSLPGKPDIVLPRHRKIILVHGCFWHQHPGCRRATVPATNVEFWTAKLNRNRERDAEVRGALEEMGWTVLVVWQCETRDKEALRERLASFMTDGSVSKG